MTKHNLEQWNQERTEGEIRNWLIANNLWHPEALYAHLDARPAETSSMHAMDRSQAEQLLQTAAVGRLSYQAGEHRVVIPLAYAYADGAIYGALDNSLAALLRDHPRVAFQVEQVTHPLSWQSVVIQAGLTCSPTLPPTMRVGYLPAGSTCQQRYGSGWPGCALSRQT
jgi:hypothetical protein